MPETSPTARSAFLGAASAYYLAQLGPEEVPALWQVMRRHALERTAAALARRDGLRAAGQAAEGENLLRFHFAYERAAVEFWSGVAAKSSERAEADESAGGPEGRD